jgi:hypothetical protein
MSTFSQWNLAKLDKRFNLHQVSDHPVLDAWLTATTGPPSAFEQQVIVELRESLSDNVLHWNEQELSLNFIGPLLKFVNFNNQQFNLFAGRYISGTVDGEELAGKPDGLIASGWREPELPYFCLQEYKPEKDPEGDPVGQCLVAMLVGQSLNQDNKPIYGCYVLGRNWFFMVLQQQQYAISNSYVATKDEIFDIFRILRVLKEYIKQRVANQ